jgi:hypothetical protein
MSFEGENRKRRMKKVKELRRKKEERGNVKRIEVSRVK